MAQYVESVEGIPIVMDFVDVDSNKWMQYASFTRFPLSAIYRREGRTLEGYERRLCERAAAVVVKKDGLLIYSTCSLEPEENDAQVDAFLADNLNFVLEPPPEGTVAPELLEGGRLHVLPHRHGTDGAFAARLRRVS
jgi:16S rRNA C967 or C1407 C5-methylase (RsmB/RsmF family)